MSEPRLRHQPSPPPPQPSLPTLPPPSSAPKPMPALTFPASHPPSNSRLAPSPRPPNPASSSTLVPESGPSCALSSTPPSPLPGANPDRNPSATADPDRLAKAAASTTTSAAGTSTSAAPPTKIPFRPRKTRKLVASSCASAAQDLDDKTETACASSPDGDAGAVVAGGGAPMALNNHTRVVYHVPPRPLSAEGEVAAAIRHLRAADPQLANLIEAHGPPVFQSLHPPFHSLTRSILYQQLAFKAAASIYSRFLALCGGEDGVVPEVVLGLTPQQLRQIGVSARKASYLHDLANKYRNGILSDSSIVAMDDKSLFTMLNMVKGIGAWSVHMFMIFSLHRPDVLPAVDVGVRKGVQLLYGLDTLPRPSQMEQLCERWKPYRSVGSWYVWRLVEAKGMPAALATASSRGVVAATSEGGGGGMISHVVGVLPPLPPPLPPLHLRQQIQQQHPPQHQHLQQHQYLHLAQHPHPHQRQHQHQLQLQPQLIDAIQSVPNLG